MKCLNLKLFYYCRFRFAAFLPMITPLFHLKMLSIIFLLPSPIFHLLAVFMSLLPIKFLPLLSLS
nr:MAG TPA: hypothetical protein [Inoviridae sp.]